MSTPRTDANCGWPWGHHGRIECSDLRWSPDGPFVHSEVARAIERENAALRAQDAWLIATFSNREDENQKLRAELEAQAVVNGKGGEREAKLLAEVAALRKAKDMLEVERCECLRTMDLALNESAGLRADRDRLDFLESTTGSGWALLHLDEGKQLTRKQIDRRMATEPKP